MLAPAAAAASAPVLSDVDRSQSEMRPLIQRYSADRGNLLRFYTIKGSPGRRARLGSYYRQVKTEIEALNFDGLSQDAKVDYIVFRNELEHELRELDREEREEAENAPYVPFAAAIVGLEESRRAMNPVDAAQAARALTALGGQIEAARKAVEAKLKADSGADAARGRKIVGARAAAEAATLRETLRRWFTFYNAYDPAFTWWAEVAYKSTDAALEAHIKLLRERVAGLPAARGGARRPGREEEDELGDSVADARAGSMEDIAGNPLGRDGLMSELAYEMIPYTPEQLIAIANKEYAWCEAEMKKASREMGFGDDWKRAVEKIKTLYVEPGKQPQMIRDLAREAEAFLDAHDLVTVPAIARETWRMEMMTPERQLVAPFFLGGEVISVSYPTNGMSFDQKMTTMRGNNVPMSRATVFHELIPGHHLQGYYGARFRPYRSLVSGTPFVTEGWSLYWELLMWELKFQRTPEDRVGALVWRMHRCARIIFSLKFHLGQMTPAECVDFLVDKVGFERPNAVGEVRRSFSGAYSPLYQAAYLVGGIQLKSLHDSLTGAGKMTNREFNDAVLKQNRIPIEMIRAGLTGQKLTRNYTAAWKFYGDIPAGNP